MLQAAGPRGVRTLNGSDRAASGLTGLDDILGGGFVPGRIHLVEGKAGTGKTTLGMQFILAGRDRGEKVLYITMSETLNELQAVVPLPVRHTLAKLGIPRAREASTPPRSAREG